MQNAVEEYVDALQARDWDRMRLTMTDDVRREGAEGPATDAVVGLDDYMKWTADLLGPLHSFSWIPSRLIYAEDRRTALVESVSEYEPNAGDERFGYSLAVVFELNEDGLISAVSYYWKTPSARLAGDTVATGQGAQ